jgi:hypothetical protein
MIEPLIWRAQHKMAYQRQFAKKTSWCAKLEAAILV